MVDNLTRKLYTAIYRTGVHNNRVGFGVFKRLAVHSVKLRVFVERGEVTRLLAFELDSKPHYDVGVFESLRFTFAKLCALIRVCVPYTGMIISTRESQAVREKVIRLGVSQISGASRTSVGGYTEEIRPTDSEQFDVSDQRTLDEVVRWLMEMGYIPSFCTAC